MTKRKENELLDVHDMSASLVVPNNRVYELEYFEGYLFELQERVTKLITTYGPHARIEFSADNDSANVYIATQEQIKVQLARDQERHKQQAKLTKEHELLLLKNLQAKYGTPK